MEIADIALENYSFRYVQPKKQTLGSRQLMVSRLSMAENRCIVNDIVLKMSFWVILFEESSICSIIFNKAKVILQIAFSFHVYDLFKISVSWIKSMLTLFVCNKKLSDLTQSLKFFLMRTPLSNFFRSEPNWETFYSMGKRN